MPPLYGLVSKEMDGKGIIHLVKDRMKPVPIEDFRAHVQRMHADRDRWFELEYNVSFYL